MNVVAIYPWTWKLIMVTVPYWSEWTEILEFCPSPKFIFKYVTRTPVSSTYTIPARMKPDLFTVYPDSRTIINTHSFNA